MSSQLKVNSIRDTSNNEALTISSGNVSFNNTISAGTIGSSVTGNWGWKLLETKTATTGDANIRIGSGTIFSSTYNLYKVIIDDYMPSTDGQLYMKWYINGDSSLQESGYDYIVRGHDSTVASRTHDSQSASAIAITPSSIASNSNFDHLYTEFDITNPSSSRRKMMGYRGHQHKDNNVVYFQGAGSLIRGAIGGTLNGILFYPSSGTITRCNIRVYGVVNA